MKLTKAVSREHKRNKRKNGMQVDNRAALLLEEQKVKKARRIQSEKNKE